MPAAAEVPSHADIVAFGAFGLEGSAKAVADAERARIASAVNVVKVLEAAKEAPGEAVVLFIAGKQTDNAQLKRQSKAATDWLILALEIAPYDEVVASLVRNLLGTQRYTCNLEAVEQWEPLCTSAQALLGKVGDRMLEPLYDKHELADRMSDAALLSHVVFHPTTLHAAAAAKAVGVPIPKLSQEVAMPGLIAAMAKAYDFDDYAAMPEMTCLLAQTLLAQVIQPQFVQAITELFGAGSEATAWCTASVAPVKGFARGYVKLYEDYLDLPSPRCQWVLDGLRCLLTAPNHLGVYWIMAALTNRFRGIQQIKNPYPLSKKDRASRSNLLLVNAIILFDGDVTIGELVNGAEANRIFAEVASSTSHGQPQGRWERAVPAAVAWLRSAAVSKLPARMSAEIQVTFDATAVGRSIMHYLYDIARGGNPRAVYDNFRRAGFAGISDVEVTARDLVSACGLGQLDRALAFVAGGADVNEVDAGGFGATGLYVAAESNHPDVVDAMIKAGAAVDQARTDTGATPLIEAATRGLQDVVAVLVDGGADVDKARTDGSTPLIMAAYFGHTGVVKVLLAAGADRAIWTKFGTAVELAKKQGHTEVVALLE